MRKSLIIILLFAIGTAFAQQEQILYRDVKSSNPAFAATLLYADGVQARIMDEREKATQLFKQLIELEPKHAAAYYQIALMNDGEDAQKMLENAERAYMLDNENDDFMQLYVRSLYTNGRFDDALKILADLRNSGKGNRQNYYLSAILAAQMNDVETVEEMARYFLEKYGFLAPMADLLTEVMVSKRQFAEAEQMLEGYIETNPMEPSIRISLAKIKSVLFKDDEAVEQYKSAIALDTTDYDSHLALADYYRIKKDVPNYLVALRPVFESAGLDSKTKAEYFERTFFDPSLLRDYYLPVQQIAMTMYASDPYDTKIEDVYIRFMMYTGDVANAKKMLITKLNEERADEETYSYLIEIENYTKQPDSALNYAKMATDRFATNTLFPMMIASIESERGNNDAALKELAVVMKRAVTDSLRCIIKSFEGDIYFKMGKSKKAFAAYDKALGYDAENAMLLNNYAYYLSLEKIRLTEALDMAQRANRLSEGNATYLDTQAWILYELGRYEEARTTQRRAIALSTEKSADMLLHYGDILFKLGEAFLAETYWKQAAEAGADASEIEKRMVNRE